MRKNISAIVGGNIPHSGTGLRDNMSKPINEIETWIDNDFHKRKGIGIKKRTLFAFFSVSIIILAISGTSLLLSFFAEINVDINVTEVLKVDGMSCPALINDNITVQACSYQNVTHNISNLHSSKSITVDFNITQIDEGLTVSFFDNITKTELTNTTVSPNDYKIIIFQYDVACNVDPNENVTATIQVEYLE